MVEFMTRSGILTAKKVPEAESTGAPGEEQGKQFIELDFPRIDFVDCNSSHEMPSIPKTLNGAPIISVHKSATDGDLIVMPLPFFSCILSYLRLNQPPVSKLEHVSATKVIILKEYLVPCYEHFGHVYFKNINCSIQFCLAFRWNFLLEKRLSICFLTSMK